MDNVRDFTWRGVTILASMDDQTESMTSLPRRSRFFVMVLLCFCFVTFVFLYTNNAKPTTKIRHIDKVKEAWHIGEFGHHKDDEDGKSKSPLNITNAQSSTYRFGGSSGIVMSKGTTLQLVIEARDLAGRRTARGGDMWYATMNSVKPKASTAGRVTDNGDGTYDVTFHAGWQGVARIDIILVHPKEACSFVEKKVWPVEDRVVWLGTFMQKTATKPRTDVKTCVLRRNSKEWVNKCEYWYPLEVGDTMLICGKPDHGKYMWSCDDLYSLKILKERIKLAAAELIEGREYLFDRGNVMQMVENGPKHVQIEDAVDYQPAVLSPCRSAVPTPDVEGYWLNDNWHSLRCHNSQWGVNASNRQDAARCLRGKEIYFLGDTTSRQWFEAFQEAIGFKFFLRNDDAHYRFFRQYPHLNVSILYQAHPLLMTSAQVPFEEVEFEVDVLDRLTNKECNYIVLLSPWSYTNWDRASFAELLHLQKEAVVRLMVRCPEAKVVVRGPHPVAHGTSDSSTYADNILLLGIRDLIAQTFRGTGASFLDVWDMSLAYPNRNNIIMPAEVTQQWLYLFMSYVC